MSTSCAYQCGRSYEEIKAECRRDNKLWTDPDFPPNDQSLYHEKAPSMSIEWKRPHEICDDPKFFVGGTDRTDIVQGHLGDCWLLAAVACLTTNDNLVQKVVNPNQSFSKEYTGLFRFKFWRYGEWLEVVVDDHLPTSNGELIYLHSNERNEFWSALLEKAYAKLHGCYEKLKGGNTGEGLTDLTGGVVQRFNLRKAPQDLFRIMLKAQKRASLMGCSIDALDGVIEGDAGHGLIQGHAYSVTCVRTINVKTPSGLNKKLEALRLRNPWGQAEWDGRWSDNSQEWQRVSEAEKQEMGLTVENDGEFWMSFEDFMENFHNLELCYLDPRNQECSSDGVGYNLANWHSYSLHGGWRKDENAGGCVNYKETFWSNPQYNLTLSVPDEDEDGFASVVISLMQKGSRQNGQDNETIGFAIYKIGFQGRKQFVANSTFINLREVCERHKFRPGKYLIVPSTFSPNAEADYILRIFSENKALMGSSSDEEPQCCFIS